MANNTLKPVQQKARVLIVDDHPIVRQGIGQMINEEADLVVCGEADDFTAALEAVGKFQPDVAIIDISLRGTNGIDLIREIHQRNANLPILVLSMHDESIYAERALRAGAKGYVMKQEAIQSVLGAIRKVLKNELYVSGKLTNTILQRMFDTSTSSKSPVDLLTDRELEVFQLIGQGQSTKRIADGLHLSVKTVETHRAHIKEKLGLKNAFELVQEAVQFVAQSQNRS